MSRSANAQAAAGWIVVAVALGWSLLWLGVGIVIGAWLT